MCDLEVEECNGKETRFYYLILYLLTGIGVSAWVMIGLVLLVGLVAKISTLLTLIVVPSVYSLVEKGIEWTRQSRNMRKKGAVSVQLISQYS